MLLEASDVEIFAVKVEVDFYFEMEEVQGNGNSLADLTDILQCTMVAKSITLQWLGTRT